MHPIHDVDVLLLLATTLSSKRRPAELVEIIVAADLIQGSIPFEEKLGESFQRLSTHGLLAEVEGGFTLTAEALKIMAALPRKGDTAERIFRIKEKLAGYQPVGEYAAIHVTAEQLGAAMLAQRTAAASATRSALVPKPKPVDDDARRPAPWRKFGGARKPGAGRKPTPTRRRG